MKVLSKYILIIFIGLSALQTYSQTLRLKGGVNRSDVFYDYKNGDLSSAIDMTMQGFHAGGTMENSLTELLSLETGLFVSLKGFKIDELLDGVTVRNKTNLYYLDIPATLKAAFKMGATSKWYLVAGPYFDIGMVGNYSTVYDWSGDKQAIKEKIKWGDGEDEIERFDFGLSFGGGIEFSVWQIGIYYDLGINNISPDAKPDNTLKNRVWKISVGYKLGGK